ncbi:unnamed protein product, partial [Rotaria magnacalcarata]
ELRGCSRSCERFRRRNLIGVPGRSSWKSSQEPSRAVRLNGLSQDFGRLWFNLTKFSSKSSSLRFFLFLNCDL